MAITIPDPPNVGDPDHVQDHVLINDALADLDANKSETSHTHAGVYQQQSEKGAANGYAPLGSDSKVPAANLPAAQAPVTDHGALTGLSDDDHTIYLTNGRGDARYDALGTASAGNAAHVAAADPHTQYLTEARGDARYDLLGAAATKWTRWTGTQAQYDALGTYDPSTLYVIAG